MRNAGSTTIIEIVSLLLLTITIGTISDHFTASALAVTTMYLSLTLWRRNGLYRWLEEGKRNETLLSSDLWRDILRPLSHGKIRRDYLSKSPEIEPAQLVDWSYPSLLAIRDD